MVKNPNHPPKPVTSTGSSPHIALIGCGAIAESYYLPALARHPRVLETLILVDQNIDRARKLAAALNVKQCFADYREVLFYIEGCG